MLTKSQITKLFGKTSNLFFFEKRKFANKITLEDSEENILTDDTLVSEELNNFFQNATKVLNINENSDTVDKAINTYKNHPSILLIIQKLENVDNFTFEEFSISETEKELRKPNFNKTTTFDKMPTKILKH